MKTAYPYLAALAWITAALAGSAAAHMPAEFHGPLAGWVDARRDFGAVGDGKADDTRALQAALDALRDPAGKAVTLYLPAGTYRITGTLTLPRKGGGGGDGGREAAGLNIQGEDPDKTVIVWDGPAGGAMLEYGAWYSTLGRVTFDGAGRAGIGVRHGPAFVTANEIADVSFRDVAVGIEAGDPERAGIAETSAVRCKFVRCSTAGVSLRNWNSLDWWLWHCQFEDCGVGATNAQGMGNFHVYQSVFRRSKEADVTIGHTGYLSFRFNTSVGSKAFFVAGPQSAACQLTFQGNTVIDPVDTQAIRVGNLGPVFLLDNTIVSRADVTEGPVAAGADAQVVSAGNTFTVPEAGAVRFKAGSIRFDERTAARGTLSLAEPALPGAPPRSARRVIEVAAGADGAAIQAAIDSAAKLSGTRPIVHLPPGRYEVKRTLTIPAGCDVSLVGEGIPYVTQLAWTGEGAGPLLHLPGPSRARISNLAVVAGEVCDGIVADRCDQDDARVLLDQVQADGAADAGLWVGGMERAAVLMRDIGHSNCAVGVRVEGGPRLARGEAVHGRVVILSGASSTNRLSYDITRGGRLLARDIWYETGSEPRFARLTGKGDFTLHGSIVAHPRRPGEPAWEVDGFDGRVALLGVSFTQVGDAGAARPPAVVVRGEDPRTRVLLLGCHGHGEYFADESRGARAARVNCVRFAAGGAAEAIADAGTADAAWVREMLAFAREPHRWPDAAARDVPEGATDLSLHRVFLRKGRSGLVLRPGDPPAR